ncbi:right-handed parallel beta-helix repeat-containing protein, partial [uncultured Methanobrevibacter sp.]|uniref:right-handed parallel beta-helix repeat-containing protein n=1 Tax=uncultured Methanobrevibacter sp. TaxID=253161 RepID=UPI002621FE06
MLNKLLNGKVILIAFILVLFLAIPSSFAGDSSAIDIADNSSYDIDGLALSSVDSQVSNDISDSIVYSDDNILSDENDIADDVISKDSSFKNSLESNKLNDGSVWSNENLGTSYDTLYEAVSAASSNDTIVCIEAGSEYLSNLTINKDICIKAQSLGDMTLKSYGKNIFYLNSGCSLTLENLVFSGISLGSGMRGAAVFGYGDITVNNCQFSNITTDLATSYGGVIYSDKSGAKVKISSSVFENISTAIGVTHISGGTLELSDCNFKNIRSYGYGGAVYSWGSDVLIENCQFIDSTLSEPMIFATQSYLSVNNSVFKNLKSSDYAAGIYLTYKAEGKITNTLFDSCTSTYSPSYSSSSSGAAAIASEGEYVEIANCTFINGQETGFYTGTTIKGVSGAILINSEADIYNCIFLNNSVNSRASYGYNDILALEPIYANYNYWGSNDGVNESLVRMDYVTVNNWYILDLDTDGDVICTFDKEITFSLNQIKNRAGEISSADSLNDINLTVIPSLSNTESYELQIVNGTGVINYNSQDAGTEILKINNVSDEFSFPVLADASSSIYVAENGSNDNDGSLNAPYATIEFALSKVSSSRNIIYIKPGRYNESNLLIDKSVSILSIDNGENNVIIDAQGNGPIFSISKDLDVVIRDISLVNGKTESDGGAIYVLDGTNLSLNNVKIINSSAENGGAIYSEANLIISDSEFINNTADEYGGAIMLLGSGENIISSSNFTNGSANNGGALAVKANLVLDSSRLEYNNASLNGGAVYVDNSKNGLIEIKNNFLNVNIAQNGGAAYIYGGDKQINLSNNIFAENTANSYGGAIALNETLVKMTQNNMGGNEAHDGDKIYLQDSKVNAKLVFMKGDTVNAYLDQTLSLNASVTDDLNNTISGGNIIFYVNDDMIGSSPIVDGIALIDYTVSEITSSDLMVWGVYDGASDDYSLTKGYIHTVSHHWFIEGGSSYEYLSDAVAAAKANDVIYGLPGTYTINQVVVDKSLTIKALNNGEITLKGSNSKIFNITKNSKVNLINLTFTNGSSTGYGGLIEARGNITLINCTFENNALTNYSAQGAAIFLWDYSELTIDSCEFRNLSNVNTGGAVYVYYDYSRLTVKNSTFDNISGRGNGTVIYSSSPVEIYDSNFTNILGSFYIGTVTYNYAAVYVGDSLTVNNSRFINITGPRASAIAVIHSRATLNISHSVFANNLGLNTTIWSKALENHINYCLFINNTGVSGNYWDYIGDGYYLEENDLEYNYWESNEKPVYNFANSSVENWVILDISSDENMLIAGSTNDIHVDLSRYTDGENVKDLEELMPDYIFELNATKGEIDSTVELVEGHGIAKYIAPIENVHVYVYIEPSDQFLEFDVMQSDSVIFVSNTGSDTSGLGTYDNPYASIGFALTQVNDVKNIIFIDDGLYNESDLSIDKAVTIQGRSIDNVIIDAGENGRIFKISDSADSADIPVIITSLTLINGNSDNGGAIYADWGDLMIYNIVVKSSSADNGAALYLATDADIHDNVFIDNDGDANGVIYLASGDYYLSNNIINNSDSSPVENAIHVYDASLNVKIVYLDNKTVEIPKATQTNLTAVVSDDMDNLISGGKLEFIAGAAIIGNASVDKGIATVLYTVPNTENSYVISGSYSNGNDKSQVKTGTVRSIKLGFFVNDVGYETLAQAVDAANEGDTIIAIEGKYDVSYEYLTKSLTVKANGSDEVVLHLSGRYLFEIEQENVRLNLEGLTFENANGYGGFFIYNQFGIVNINNCTFRDSALETVTAVIYTYSGILNINNTNFGDLYLTESSTSGRGGAIGAVNSYVYVNNSNFNRNNAGSYGGAIYLSSSTLNVFNSTFQDNHAGFRGGAIYGASGSTLYADNCRFINNSATAYTSSYGGAVCVESGQVTITRSLFMDNFGRGKGGAIYVARNASFNYNVFINNIVDGGYGDDIYFNWFNETYPDEKVNAEYNYWLSNEGPIGNKIGTNIVSAIISTDKWVILEPSINETTVILGPTYTVTADLTHYVYNDKVYKLEDNIAQFDLELSAVLGNLDDDISSTVTVIDGIATAIYTPLAIGNETIYFEPTEQTLKFYVDFGSDYYISANESNIIADLGDSYSIDLSVLDKYRTITNDLDGQYIIVSYKVDNQTYTLSDKKLVKGSYASFNINELVELEAGDSCILTFALEDTSYDLDSMKVKLTINRLVTEIIAEDTECTIDSGDLNIKLLSGEDPLADKELTVVIQSDDGSYNYTVKTISTGAASVNLGELSANNYTAKISFAGDGNYLSCEKEINIVVNKYQSSIEAEDINQSISNASLEIVLLNGTNRISSQEIKILILSNEDNFTVLEETVMTNNLGIYKLDLNELAIGQYTAYLSYEGNDKFEPSERISNIEIYQLILALDVEDTIVTEGSGALEITLIANGIGLPNEIINVSIASFDYRVLTDSQGKASVDLSDLVVGEYNAIVSFAGDGIYYPIYTSVNILVNANSGTDNGTDNGTDTNGTDTNGTDTNDTDTNLTNIRDARIIQELIDNASDGDIINLGNYVYENASNIEINKNITLKGKQTTIIGMGDGSPLFIIPSVSESGVERVIIEGIDFVANNGDVLVKAKALNGTSPLSIDVPMISIVNNTVTASEGTVAESVTILELESERGVLAPTRDINVSGNTFESGVNPFKFDVTGFVDNSDANVPVGGNIPDKLATEIICNNMTTNAINTVLDGRNGEYFNFKLVDSNGNALA